MISSTLVKISPKNEFIIMNFNYSLSDPSVELYPQDYCKIVTEVTTPTCLEMGICELWAKNGYDSQTTLDALKDLTQEDIINAVNDKTFSEIFLFNKDFKAYLGGIEKNSSGHIIGAKATTIHFYGRIDLDAITEADKKANNFGAPVSLLPLLSQLVRKARQFFFLSRLTKERWNSKRLCCKIS